MTSSPITDEMLDRALHARVPGGAEVWAFLPQKDAFTPSETARNVVRAAVEAAMRSSAPPVMGMEERYRKALTPSAETKAEYIGEFSFRVPLGEDGYIEPAVPWTTIKEIMAAIRARAELSTPLVTGRE
jgi:hypothetical protein